MLSGLKRQDNRIKMQQINNQHCSAPACRCVPVQHPFQIKQLTITDDSDAVALAEKAPHGTDSSCTSDGTVFA